jgi:hypothetical protein
MTASFQVLSNWLFTNHSIIRQYITKNWQHHKINHKYINIKPKHNTILFEWFTFLQQKIVLWKWITFEWLCNGMHHYFTFWRYQTLKCCRQAIFRVKSVKIPRCSPQNPHWLLRNWTPVSGMRLITCATAWPVHGVSYEVASSQYSNG